MSVTQFLSRERLASLFDVLRAARYRIVGPKVKDGAIVFETITSAVELPRGVRDDQQPGQYRLRDTGDQRMFAWANGPQAIKPLVFAAHEPLWTASGEGNRSIQFRETLPEPEPVAVIGARPCDLAALAIQDRHFMEGTTPDPYYAARRERLFLVALHCTHPAATCFCNSTGDGPGAISGFDLVMTELDEGFIVGSGSPKGKDVLARLPTEPASPAQLTAADQVVEHAAEVQSRKLPGRDLRAGLFANLEHPRWEQVAGRCLSCGNCTMVCPTCFCHSEGEMPRLDGKESLHYRQWDSCFTQGHSYIHGFVIREETRMRYRQWLTHKLGSWHDQFGRSGCVGCGRCITWCPVGIDITEEAAAIVGEGEQ